MTFQATVGFSRKTAFGGGAAKGFYWGWEAGAKCSAEHMRHGQNTEIVFNPWHPGGKCRHSGQRVGVCAGVVVAVGAGVGRRGRAGAFAEGVAGEEPRWRRWSTRGVEDEAVVSFAAGVAAEAELRPGAVEVVRVGNVVAVEEGFCWRKGWGLKGRSREARREECGSGLGGGAGDVLELEEALGGIGPAAPEGEEFGGSRWCGSCGRRRG